MATKILGIEEIKVDEKNYPRNKWSWQTSWDYANSMRAGSEFPPIEVAMLRRRYFLVDGRHRLEANRMNKEVHIQATINRRIKTTKSLYIESVKRNIANGRQFSVQDKIQIYVRLKDMRMKDAEISRLIQVPLDKLDAFTYNKITNTYTGDTIVLKAPLKNMGGTTVRQSLEQEQQVFSSHSQISILDELITLLRNKYIDLENKEVKKRFETLITLINGYLEPTGRKRRKKKIRGVIKNDQKIK